MFPPLKFNGIFSATFLSAISWSVGPLLDPPEFGLPLTFQRGRPLSVGAVAPTRIPTGSPADFYRRVVYPTTVILVAFPIDRFQGENSGWWCPSLLLFLPLNWRQFIRSLRKPLVTTFRLQEAPIWEHLPGYYIVVDTRCLPCFPGVFTGLSLVSDCSYGRCEARSHRSSDDEYPRNFSFWTGLFSQFVRSWNPDEDGLFQWSQGLCCPFPFFRSSPKSSSSLPESHCEPPKGELPFPGRMENSVPTTPVPPQDLSVGNPKLLLPLPLSGQSAQAVREGPFVWGESAEMTK